jgi:hypothetical protein
MPRTVHWSRSPGGSSTAVVTTPSTTSAERGGMQPALLRDQTVDIFLDETLVAIDARSTWHDRHRARLRYVNADRIFLRSAEVNFPR